MIIRTETKIVKLKTTMLIQKELFNDEINSFVSLPRSSDNEAIQNLQADLVKNFPHVQIVL